MPDLPVRLVVAGVGEVERGGQGCRDPSFDFMGVRLAFTVLFEPPDRCLLNLSPRQPAEQVDVVQAINVHKNVNVDVQMARPDAQRVEIPSDHPHGSTRFVSRDEMEPAGGTPKIINGRHSAVMSEERYFRQRCFEISWILATLSNDPTTMHLNRKRRDGRFQHPHPTSS